MSTHFPSSGPLSFNLGLSALLPIEQPFQTWHSCPSSRTRRTSTPKATILNITVSTAEAAACGYPGHLEPVLGMSLKPAHHVAWPHLHAGRSALGRSCFDLVGGVGAPMLGLDSPCQQPDRVASLPRDSEFFCRFSRTSLSCTAGFSVVSIAWVLVSEVAARAPWPAAHATSGSRDKCLSNQTAATFGRGRCWLVKEG